MNRRLFLGSSLAVALGCSRQSTAERQRLAEWKTARNRHLNSLSKVPPTAHFTTPPAPIDILQTHPELKGLTKIAMRLHPRYADEPAVAESKIGGRFLWPAADPWPTHAITKQPLAAIVQLKLDDAPPQFPFPKGTDLLQLFWSPTGELKPIIAWTDSKAVNEIAEPPAVAGPNVPVPCRVFPERIAERPGLDLLPAIEREKLNSIPDYDEMLSVAHGTKIGGYCRRLKASDGPMCPSCRRGMDFLLTIDSAEWSHPRWRPIEETDDSGRNHLHLDFGSTHSRVHIFICRRCEHWPIRHLLA